MIYMLTVKQACFLKAWFYIELLLRQKRSRSEHEFYMNTRHEVKQN